jgi:phenylalanyl-tRNA synthetase alpha chain
VGAVVGYTETTMESRRYIIAQDPEASRLQEEITKRTDVQGQRLQRLLALQDLSRKENSPIKFLVDAVLGIDIFKKFDVLQFPEIVPVKYNFDLLNTPQDHPSRKETDTYYADASHVLRTHTTTMWPYYLSRPEIRQQLETSGEAGLLAHGKVYRKDEIDRSHFPVFHQVDGLYICKKEKKALGIPELQEVLSAITKAIYGEGIVYRFLEDTFPFTNPSTQIEIKISEKEKAEERWLEVVGAGVVHTQVLRNLDIDPEVYNGWAFGFGLERLAMVKMQIPDIRVFWSEDPRITGQFKDINSQYTEVSKYPMTYRDISFVVDKSVSLNNYYEIVRDFAENLIEEVKLVDTYENEEKFGAGKVSYTFRITYRSPERTLTNEEVNAIQEKIIEKTKSELHADIR